MFGFFNRGGGQGNGQDGNQDRQYDFGYDTETTASLTDSDSEISSVGGDLNGTRESGGSLRPLVPIRRLSIVADGPSSVAARFARIEDAIDIASGVRQLNRDGEHVSAIDQAIQRSQAVGTSSLLERITSEQNRSNRDEVFRSGSRSSVDSDEMTIRRSNAFDQGDQSPPRGSSGGRAM